jgi:hypothetical protein
MSNQIKKSIPNVIIVSLLILTVILRFSFNKECTSSHGNIFHLTFLFSMSVIFFIIIQMNSPINKKSIGNLLFVLLITSFFIAFIYLGILELIELRLSNLTAFLIVLFYKFKLYTNEQNLFARLLCDCHNFHSQSLLAKEIFLRIHFSFLSMKKT